MASMYALKHTHTMTGSSGACSFFFTFGGAGRALLGRAILRLKFQLHFMNNSRNLQQQNNIVVKSMTF